MPAFSSRSSGRTVARLVGLLTAAVGCIALGWVVAPAATADDGASPARADIQALLDLQSAAWTSGDLEAFVSIYAEQARFLSSTGLTTGRAEVLARYKTRYPDAAAMGALRLEIVDFVPFTAADGHVVGASVVARWFLSYPQDAERDDADGLTLLTFSHRPNVESGGHRFEIVHDASM